MNLYSSDQTEVRFSTTASNGRWVTPLIVAGPSWTFTLHGIPTNPGIRVEANNSAVYKEGTAGITNPINFAIQSANEHPHSFTSYNAAFESNWVAIKPESEFYLSSNSGAVTCETGVWPLQGVFRFIRLSMTATPSADTRGYYFSTYNILRG